MSQDGSEAESSVSTKEQHLKLAGVVKGVHAKLRKTYKKDGSDYEAMWAAHLEDKQLLSEYADAMHHLATDIWTKHPETRIDWCKKICNQYFFDDSGLKKQLEKDTKRKYYADLNLNKEQVHSEDEEDVKRPEELAEPKLTSGTGDNERNDFSSENERNDFSSDNQEDQMPSITCLEEKRKAVHEKYQPRQYSTITAPFSGLIRLLDVGSCYNPFLEFEQFLAVGIDISPAVESVYHCDFLHVETTEPLQMATDSIDSFVRNGLKDPIVRLPRNVFHVVVFSLLLEYFPCPYQRWVCCQRAHELLSVNGLLLIITPDSHHQNKNAKMMKSWKTAIESMGFLRWRYEKLEHLHCMAFRKIELNEKEDGLIPEANADMLYIPQDYNDGDNQRENFYTDFSQPLFDEENIRQDLEQLPDFVDL